jgi:hypothetical protein
MNDIESIPGCFGEFGSPRAPNGPCVQCPSVDLCKHTKEFYVSKNKLKLQLITKIDEILKECNSKS